MNSTVCFCQPSVCYTRCNISFGARGIRSAAPSIWNSLPSHVRSCETLTTFRRHLKSHFFHSALPTAVTHLSASDSFSTMALYKSIYLFTYLLTYLLIIPRPPLFETNLLHWLRWLWSPYVMTLQSVCMSNVPF